jgi:hypothetical protein
MAKPTKNITGTEELLDKVFGTPEMDDVVARMKRVQSGANRPSAPTTVTPPPDTAKDNTPDNTKANTLSHALSDSMSDCPSDGPTVRPVVRPTVRPTVRPSDSTTHYPTDYPTDYPTVSPSLHSADWKNKAADPVWALTHKQAKILFYLINQPDSIAQRERISNETEIPFSTVKHCIKVLSADGFISKPTKYVNRSFQGFTYTVNQGLCRQFLEKRGHEFSGSGDYPALCPSDCPTPYPSHGPAGGMSHGLSGAMSDHYSSSLKSNTTTELETVLQTDPELGYWQDKGLQPQQVQKWMEETGMGQLLMIQSLKYCRFDMVDNNQEESKPVQNVFNWFYSIIKRTGHYPKPAGYKSWAEKMMEIEQALLEDQEAEIRRLEEHRTRKYRLEAERRFQEMLNDPGGETYKAVYERLSKLEKELGEGMAFERAMRSRFDEMLSSTGS